MQVYVLPTLPLPLYQLAYPKKLSASTSSVPGTVSTGSLSSGSSSGGMFHSDGSSISSGLTLGSSLPSGGGGTQQVTPLSTGTPISRGARIINLTPLPNLTSLVPNTVRLKEIIGNTTPPKYDNGQDMCLSFLLQNGCWSNCKRVAHHVASLTMNEQQRLAAYINQCLAVLQPAPLAGQHGATNTPVAQP